MVPLVLSLDSFLPYKLSFASNLVSEVISTSYARLFGLKVPEWRILAVIAETGGANQLEIGQLTRMDKVTVSRAALAMQGRGLVDRTPNPADGRSHILSLSDAGVELYGQVVPQAIALEQAVFADLCAAELSTLSNILDKIRNAAINHIEGRCPPTSEKELEAYSAARNK